MASNAGLDGGDSSFSHSTRAGFVCLNFHPSWSISFVWSAWPFLCFENALFSVRLIFTDFWIPIYFIVLG
jgi:hypothetical protein